MQRPSQQDETTWKALLKGLVGRTSVASMAAEGTKAPSSDAKLCTGERATWLGVIQETLVDGVDSRKTYDDAEIGGSHVASC
jgi:hypothetical protein